LKSGVQQAIQKEFPMISPMQTRSLFSGMRARRLGLALALLVASLPSQAQTYTVIHEFGGFPNDGRMPTAPLIEDAQGNLYGTTYGGGLYGGGVVFKLDANGNETILHNFLTGAFSEIGSNPAGGVVRDGAGNLYGTTENGGGNPNTAECPWDNGCGVLFKITATNDYQVLRPFGGKWGSLPNTSLFAASSGILYGTTQSGGPDADGSLYSVDPATEEVTFIHSFDGHVSETSGLVEDAQGNLWTTAASGGIYRCWLGYEVCGALVEFRADNNYLGSGDALTFPFKSDGVHARGGLVVDTEGTFYGTTQNGGNFACSDGCGVVFKFDPSTGLETVLHWFSGLGGGAFPVAGVVRDSLGNLYGTTQFGGKTSTAGGGYGIVFKLDTLGNLTVLHRFDGTDGAQPQANLLLDSSGTLYGTTAYGGSTACKNGCGVVFKITPQ
jgi:uncharacterized repeat protein (TIGR03803 family)